MRTVVLVVIGSVAAVGILIADEDVDPLDVGLKNETVGYQIYFVAQSNLWSSSTSSESDLDWR